MAFKLEPRAGKTCPRCSAEMKDCALGWRCPICQAFVDMDGGLHLHEEKPLAPPATNFDKITASPEVLSDFIVKEVLGIPAGTAAKMAYAAWCKFFRRPCGEEETHG